MSQRIQTGTVYSVEMSDGRATVARAVRRRGRVIYEVLVRDIDPATDAAWPPLVERIAREQEKGSAILAGIVLASDSFMRTLEVPFSSLAKARAVLPSRLDVELPVPVERCACAFVGLSRLSGRAGARAVAVAAPDDRLDATLKELQALQLDPEWMEQEALLLWRMAGAEQAGNGHEAAPRVLLYLASDRVVAVAGREGSPFSSFSAKLAWSGDEATRGKVLARLRPYLASVTREAGMENPHFLVAGALAREHADGLRVALEVKPDAWRVCPHPETGLVRALAASGLMRDEWSGNLRTGKATHANLQRLMQRQNIRAASWVAAGAIALLLASTTASWLARSTQRQWQALVQQRAREITGMASVPRGQEVFVARQYVEGARASDELASRWLSPGAYPLFNHMLRLAHGREVELDSMSVGPDRVVLRGRAEDASEAGHFVDLLEQDGWSAGIETGEVDEDGRYLFTVRGQMEP